MTGRLATACIYALTCLLLAPLIVRLAELTYQLIEAATCP